MGNGAYGASFAGPGFGTDNGAGSGGSVACGVFWPLPQVTVSAVNSSGTKAFEMVFRGIAASQDYITDAARSESPELAAMSATMRGAGFAGVSKSAGNQRTCNIWCMYVDKLDYS
jgi:hypothetical protein